MPKDTIFPSGFPQVPQSFDLLPCRDDCPACQARKEMEAIMERLNATGSPANKEDFDRMEQLSGIIINTRGAYRLPN